MGVVDYGLTIVKEEWVFWAVVGVLTVVMGLLWRWSLGKVGAEQMKVLEKEVKEIVEQQTARYPKWLAVVGALALLALLIGYAVKR